MRRSLEILLTSTEALAKAVANGDEVALATALDARREAFANVRDEIPEDPPRDVQEKLARIFELDAAIGAAARSARETLQRELAELRRLREAVGKLEPEPEGDPPRFVSRRA